ncbi:MAG: YIP1 family protein, partial [Desulfovibrio sp.]|nr:YIP1 family protein [Desulfovibrio sp.]
GAVVLDPLERKETADGHGQSAASSCGGSASGSGAKESGADTASAAAGAAEAAPAPGKPEAEGAAGAEGKSGAAGAVAPSQQQDGPQKKAARLDGHLADEVQAGQMGQPCQAGQPDAWQDGTPGAWGGGQPGQQGQSSGHVFGGQGRHQPEQQGFGQQDSGRQGFNQRQGWHQGPETWGDIPEEGEAAPGPFNPWDEAPRPSGWLSAFYQTCIRAMFAPARFFSSLTPRPVLKALAFYLLVCALQIAMQQVWAQVFLSYIQPLAGSDPQLQKMAEALSGQDSFALTLILRLAALTLQIYIFSGLLTLAWRIIAPGKANYAVVFQVLAYAEAPGILCLVPAIGAAAGLIWGFACMLIGARAAFGLSWGQTLLGFLPLVLLLLPSLMQVASLLGV